MSTNSPTPFRPLSLFFIAIVSLVFASSCNGGGGGDKARDACEDLIDGFAECLDVPLNNEQFEDGVDLCEDELIAEADDLGGGDCVDAVVELIDCVVEQDCELIELLVDNELDEMDFEECADEIEELGASCDG